MDFDKLTFTARKKLISAFIQQSTTTKPFNAFMTIGQDFLNILENPTLHAKANFFDLIVNSFYEAYYFELRDFWYALNNIHNPEK